MGPLFLRPFNDSELDKVEKFLARLQRKRVRYLEDRVVWAGDKDGQFTVRDCIMLLLEMGRIESFPSNLQKIFIWEVAWCKISYLDKLQRRGWILVNRFFFMERRRRLMITFFCIVLSLELFGIFFFLLSVLWMLPSIVKDKT